jgi:predicted peptidase
VVGRDRLALLAVIAAAMIGAVVGPPRALSAQAPAGSIKLDDEMMDGFVEGTFTTRTETMPFRLFIPDPYNARQSYPLVLWLHGTGGAGRDNWRQILDDQVPGTHTWTTRANQAAHPAFVLAPQASGSWGAQAGGVSTTTLSVPLESVLALLDTLQRNFSIDPRRIYIAGQSDGGFAVWRLITARPTRFAAAIVLCGGADLTSAPRAARMPIWVFHGDSDPLVPVASARQLVAALTKAGGHPRYTEYRGVGHEVWTRAFDEPGLVDWLFAQHTE